MKKNYGALLALLALIGIVAVAVSFDISTPYRRDQNSGGVSADASQNNHVPGGHVTAAPSVAGFFTDHNAAISALSSIVIAIFAGVLAWRMRELHLATRGLQQVAAEQARDMKESLRIAAVAALATKQATEASKVQADAGAQTLEIMKDTAQRQLRAYVFVAQIKILDASRENPRAEIVIRNSGQTPAREIMVSTVAQIFDFPPRQSVFDPTPVGPDSSKFVLGSDGTGYRHVSLETVLTSSSLQGLRNRQRALYVAGEILYDDVFGNHQWTQFRFMIGGETGWPETGLMVACQEGNQAK